MQESIINKIIRGAHSIEIDKMEWISFKLGDSKLGIGGPQVKYAVPGLSPLFCLNSVDLETLYKGLRRKLLKQQEDETKRLKTQAEKQLRGLLDGL